MYHPKHCPSMRSIHQFQFSPSKKIWYKTLLNGGNLNGLGPSFYVISPINGHFVLPYQVHQLIHLIGFHILYSFIHKFINSTNHSKSTWMWLSLLSDALRRTCVWRLARLLTGVWRRGRATCVWWQTTGDLVSLWKVTEWFKSRKDFTDNEGTCAILCTATT